MSSINFIKQGISKPVAFFGRQLISIDKGFNKIKAKGLLSTLKSVGSGNAIDYPIKVDGARYITLGNHVSISWNTRLYCVNKYGNQTFMPELILDDRVYVGQGCHIVACRKIHIESDVMLGSSCYVSDNLHDYTDVDVSINRGLLKVPGEVVIGAGSWLGNHTCVFGNIRIGKHCVVGANSVVNRNIPDYSVAVGAPAKIIKRYDFETQAWRKTDEHGNFLLSEVKPL
ncbi:MAG: acyltransferase [Elainellaceae cyanobacterium]